MRRIIMLLTVALVMGAMMALGAGAATAEPYGPMTLLGAVLEVLLPPLRKKTTDCNTSTRTAQALHRR